MPIAKEPRIESTDLQDSIAIAMREARIILVGAGNIGSWFGCMSAPHVGSIRIVDRDIVEAHNALNQFYSPHHVGRSKAEILSERLRQIAPNLHVDSRAADIEDLPLGDFAGFNIAFAGLDSLRARQVISERFYALNTPYIDGATGTPMQVRVQTILPGNACMECSWGTPQYRQLASEQPCFPSAPTEVPATLAPGCAGAATASLMLAQFAKLLGPDPPQTSYEINGDLVSGRFVTSRRRRSERCRFTHETVSQLIRLQKSFAQATVADLLASIDLNFDDQPVQLEFRRGIIEDELFGAGRFSTPQRLERIRWQSLAETGLTPSDRVVVRVVGQSRLAHICFDTNYESLP